MKNLKALFTSLALVVAVVAAYSFNTKPAPPAPASSGLDDTYVWIKYDCEAESQPVEIENGQNYVEGEAQPTTGIFQPCGGLDRKCAVRYLTSQTHLVPDTDNRLPNTGASELEVIECP